MWAYERERKGYTDRGRPDLRTWKNSIVRKRKTARKRVRQREKRDKSKSYISNIEISARVGGRGAKI